MANGNAYENPSVLFGPENVSLMANTMARYRQQMAQSQEALNAALSRRRQSVKEDRAFLDRVSSPFGDAYAQAKQALNKFTSKVKDQKESLAMGNQIQNALKKVGENLNKKMEEIGANGSTTELQMATSDAVAQVTALKEQLTALTEAHTEWKRTSSLPPGDPDAILASSNPQLQLLFRKMEDGEDDIVLQQDPANPMNWLFIPLETDKEIKAEKQRLLDENVLKELQEEKELLESKGESTSVVDSKIAKIQEINNKTAPSYDDYYEDGERKEDAPTYKYDEVIGIVELGEIYKVGIEDGGNYFKHVSEVETSDFVEKHNELLEKNPSLFASEVRSGKDSMIDDTLPPASSDDLRGKKKMYDKGQIADYYLKKGGAALLDTYIDENNLEGQLESLIGGYADDYYLENKTQSGEYVDFLAMSPSDMKNEIKYFMLQDLFDQMPDFYDVSEEGELGDELGTSAIDKFNKANNVNFK